MQAHFIHNWPVNTYINMSLKTILHFRIGSMHSRRNPPAYEMLRPVVYFREQLVYFDTIKVT